MFDATVLRKIHSLGGEGILNLQDLVDMAEATFRVLELMADGNWHSANDIRMAAGIHGNPASEGLRRMRELRRAFDIEKARRDEGSREWFYRLKIPGKLF
jgi:hypothetical protein